MTNKLPSNYQQISKYLPVNYQVIFCFSCKLNYEWEKFFLQFFFVKFQGFKKNHTGSPDQKRYEHPIFGWNIKFFLLFLRLPYVKIHCTSLPLAALWTQKTGIFGFSVKTSIEWHQFQPLTFSGESSQKFWTSELWMCSKVAAADQQTGGFENRYS